MSEENRVAGSLYDIEVKTIEGQAESLAKYRGKVLLVVNTASQCGFTPQYEGLEALHREFADEGLVVLGFPCDQFGHQEPGSEEEIANFCTTKFDVSFPMHAKIEVNGAGRHPLYTRLESEAPGLLGSRNVKWNFTKFLVGRDGKVIERFGSITKPEKLGARIREALAAE
jgi:glutathione peroxidase